MYHIGEYVVYSIHGVCEISGIDRQKRSGSDVLYYVLSPQGSHGSRYFVPVDNDLAVSKMHSVLSKAEYEEIIRNLSNGEIPWEPDEQLRREKYRIAVQTGDRKELLQLIGMLYLHKRSLVASGRKFRIGDDAIFREAEKLICSEISFVFGIDESSVADYIKSAIGLEENSDILT